MMRLLHLLSSALLQLLAVFVPAALFAQRGKSAGQKFILLFCGLFLFDSIVVSVLNVELFAGQQWNWLGKTVSVLWAVLFVYKTKRLSKTEAGWTWTVAERKGVFAVIAFLLVLRLGLRFWFQGFGGSYDRETAFFEATLPGLSEEVIYRGIF